MEVIILPEMIAIGRQAWEQAEKRELGIDETLSEIYLAMYGALLMARERAGEPVH